MEKYHIYEEIGKGDFSQVFKGREKKRIEYVAIKRVDKTMMSKIVSEVQTMHRLSSPHIMRFYDWYETRNNLWLILEYCSGSDLQTLLNQDLYLPESSVRLFGLDLLAAMAYLHTNGLIHCDIRPKNVLIDEFGILKLSDFKFAKKIPKVADDSTLGLLAGISTSSKGENANSNTNALIPVQSVPFQSPELLSSSGVASIASDMYNLGCLLYLLKTGCLPFGDLTTNCAKLTANSTSSNANDEDGGNGTSTSAIAIKQGCVEMLARMAVTPSPTSAPYPSSYSAAIATKAAAAASTSCNSNSTNSASGGPMEMSSELCDVIEWLLEGNPAYRASWSDVASHPFWAPKQCSRPATVPPQPAFDTCINKIQAEEAALMGNNKSSTTTSTSNNTRIATTSNSNSNRSVSGERSPLGQTSMNSPGATTTTTTTTSSSNTHNNSNSTSNTTNTKAGGGALQLHSGAAGSKNGVKFESLLFGASADTQVKPIVGNKTIEPLQTVTITITTTSTSTTNTTNTNNTTTGGDTYRVNGTSILPETYRTITSTNCNLPQLYTLTMTSKMGQTELETHLTKVYKVLSKAVASMAGALNTLYTAIGSNSTIANALNSSSASSNIATGLGSPTTTTSTVPHHMSMVQQQQLTSSLNQLLGVCVQTQQSINADAVRCNYILSYLHTLVFTPEIANVLLNTQFIAAILRPILFAASRYKLLENTSSNAIFGPICEGTSGSTSGYSNTYSSSGNASTTGAGGMGSPVAFGSSSRPASPMSSRRGDSSSNTSTSAPTSNATATATSTSAAALEGVMMKLKASITGLTSSLNLCAYMSASLVAAMVRYGTYIVPTHLYTASDYKGIDSSSTIASNTSGAVGTPFTSTSARAGRTTTPSPARRTSTTTSTNTPSPTTTATRNTTATSTNTTTGTSPSAIASALHLISDEGVKMGILMSITTCIECIDGELVKLASCSTNSNSSTSSSTRASPMSPQAMRSTATTSTNSSNTAAKAVDVLCRLKLRLTSGLGESVFYISTTATTTITTSYGSSTGANTSASGATTAQATDGHKLPLRVVDVLARVLWDPTCGCQRFSPTNAASMGDIMKHYACKTLENVLCTGGWAVLFGNAFEYSSSSTNSTSSSTSAVTHLAGHTTHSPSTPVKSSAKTSTTSSTSNSSSTASKGDIIQVYIKLCTGLMDIACSRNTTTTSNANANSSSNTTSTASTTVTTATNEALQVSAAAATAQLMHGILVDVLHKYSNTTSSSGSTSTSAAVDTTTMTDGSIIAHILDGILETSLVAIISSVLVLKDSCVKLQQAYLNVINVVLFHCRHAMHSKEVQQRANALRMTAGEGADTTYLSILTKLERIRLKLCSSGDDIPLLSSAISLVEQTSSATVRAKALLCIALLDHASAPVSNDVLRQCVAENRRFLTALVKNLESLFAANPNNSVSILFANNTLDVSSAIIPQSPDRRGGGSTGIGGGSGGATNGASDSASSDYHLNCALSLIYHIAHVLLTAFQSLNKELKQSSSGLQKLFESQVAPSDLTFLASLQDTVTRQGAISKHCETARVCLSFATNAVLYRLLVFDKHIIGQAAEFLHTASTISGLYRKISALVKSLPTRIYKDAEPLAERLKSIVRVAEESCLSIVETISQTEVDRPLSETDGSDASTADVFGVILGHFIPNAMLLAQKPSSGDARVLASVCLRRLLPQLVVMVTESHFIPLWDAILEFICSNSTSTGSASSASASTRDRFDASQYPHLVGQVMTAVRYLVHGLPSMLSDRSPIPQYAVRLLADVALAGSPVAILVCHLLRDNAVRKSDMKFRSNFGSDGLPDRGDGGALLMGTRKSIMVALCSRLLPAAAVSQYCTSGSSTSAGSGADGDVTTSNPTTNTTGSMDDDEDGGGSSLMDPQAATLLHVLIAKTSISSISQYDAVIRWQSRSPSRVYQHGTSTHYQFLSSLFDIGLPWVLRESVHWAVISGQIDNVSVLIDLMQALVTGLAMRTAQLPDTIDARIGVLCEPDRDSYSKYTTEKTTSMSTIMPVVSVLLEIMLCTSVVIHRGDPTGLVKFGGRNWSGIVNRFFASYIATTSTTTTSSTITGHITTNSSDTSSIIADLPYVNQLRLLQDSCLSAFTTLVSEAPMDFCRYLKWSSVDISSLPTTITGHVKYNDSNVSGISSIHREMGPPPALLVLCNLISHRQVDVVVRIACLKSLYLAAKQIIHPTSTNSTTSTEEEMYVAARELRHLLRSEVLSQALRTVLGTDIHRLFATSNSTNTGSSTSARGTSEQEAKAAAELLAPWMPATHSTGQSGVSSGDAAWVHAFRRLASDLLALADGT